MRNLRKHLRRQISIVLFTMMAAISSAESLERRAAWQAKFKAPTENGVEIRELTPSSPLDQAGLQKGDFIIEFDGEKMDKATQWHDISDALVGDKPYRIRYQRDGQTRSAQANFPPLAREQHPGINTLYGSFKNPDGLGIRTIVTHPKEATQKQWPAIFVVQGLSCSSIEILPKRRSNYIRLLKDVVRDSNMLVMRVEKPGLGDSEGNCSQTDFATELQVYETALQMLLKRDDVDRQRVIVYGNSMGSTLAPYLANKYQLNGIISDGPFFRSWFEHMLEIERRIKSMQGLSQSDIQQQINRAYIPLYYGMLIDKKSYADVIKSNPELGKYNYHGPEHMYGRPMSFYHQFQDFNFEGGWANLKAPARVRWGRHDWIMSEYDIDMIAATLKANGNRNVEIFKYPLLDHWGTLHESPSDSFHGKPGRWEDKISGQIVGWAKALNAKVNKP
ncbi:alpha/beta fold hydrolase [Pseudoteredinibacter isoporae]|uniref:Pimeloyl-ACP methyl ester carboxylesterase n=1 Tax=Pseudoteredinibacter isoporae TaxID=570281 RepID=A0A7X0JPN5_9GAMM|nr:alpha/beta fold hydrolase [Pseudoteredinibacter isoporae]MBB6520002.1 pimeloyl-ACP methyl ester carboxylesterase [Pseudoteredinibacter isoporae]NHO85574.1 PDZ domain-containing protein [Pseudoteredinibacter isoporae]NIB25974.1 PDZ domain-containing protein [Pseudoteredinibacter isoporae]